MKLHWGHKIITGMILFMLFILAMSYRMFLQHTDTLVDDQYYEKGLVYDEEIKKQNNALDTAALPKFELVDEQINVSFKHPSVYKIAVMRPSDAALDQYFQTEVPISNVGLPVGNLKTGLWKMQINWVAEGKDYVITTYLTKE